MAMGPDSIDAQCDQRKAEHEAENDTQSLQIISDSSQETIRKKTHIQFVEFCEANNSVLVDAFPSL